METRRLIFALFAAFTVYMGYQLIYNWLVPPQPPQQQQQQQQQPPAVGDIPQAPPVTGTTPPVTGAAPPAQRAPGLTSQAAGPSQYVWTQGARTETIEIGGGDEDHLKLRMSQDGGAILRLWLTGRDEKDRLIHRAGPEREEENTPYELLGPVQDNGREAASFVTKQIRINGTESYDLGALVWEVSRESDRKVTYTTTLRDANDDQPRLRLTKSFTLVPGKPLINLELTIENLSDETLSVQLAQDGPIGIRKEHLQYDMRRLIAAQRPKEGAVEAGVAEQRGALKKGLDQGDLVKLAPLPDVQFIWTALTNKFFGVFTRPLPEAGDYPAYIVEARGLVAAGGTDENQGDLLARLFTTTESLPPAGTITHTFEIYAGPKDPVVLEAVNPRFVDPADLGYQIAQAADIQCFCTFQPLPQIMSWLMRKIEWYVGNYGLAIIILVLIVRTCLHPLTVFQQKSMFRMQEAMATLQPKLAVIKEKFSNDKVKLNQETMKLYAEENVNPAAGMIGMLPLFLQMPILVALWTALNTDVHLRNAPFVLWMDDLSAPDALYTFAGNGINIPLVSYFFGPITSFNLLPILMGLSMWLQQKYMPKPGMHAKLEAAKKQQTTTSKKPKGMTPEEQLRQQQMIAYMMSILFPLLFYRMPSGLTLYWMSTNVFGICETLIIRKQLKREKERRDKEGPQPKKPKKTGIAGRVLKRLAEQAEEVQKKADKVSERAPGKPTRPARKPAKKRR